MATRNVLQWETFYIFSGHSYWSNEDESVLAVSAPLLEERFLFEALINEVPQEHKSCIIQFTQLRTLSDELTAEVMDE